MSVTLIFPKGSDSFTAASPLYQWDYGQQLRIESNDIPSIVEVQFATDGMDEAITRVCAVIDGVGTVSIPDACLEQPGMVNIWIVEVGETYGRTIKSAKIKVRQRTRPSPATPVPSDVVNRYNQAVSAMDELVEAARNTVELTGDYAYARVMDELPDVCLVRGASDDYSEYTDGTPIKGGIISIFVKSNYLDGIGSNIVVDLVGSSKSTLFAFQVIQYKELGEVYCRLNFSNSGYDRKYNIAVEMVSKDGLIVEIPSSEYSISYKYLSKTY